MAALAAGGDGREEEDAEKGKAGHKRQQHVRRRKDAVSANVAHTNYEIVRAVVEELGFEVEADDEAALGCNLLWFDGSPPGEVFARLEAYQRVNHFPNTGQITRKDCLARNLNRVQRACGAEQRFDFYPRSWVLPADAQALRRYDDAQHEAGRHPTYILKPPNGARGIGIGLAKSLAKVPEGEPLLVQEYLSRPCLIEGKKFDLRLYVLVSACDPLRVFLHDDGLVRMSTEDYTPPSSKNLHNMFVHLTNYSGTRRQPLSFLSSPPPASFAPLMSMRSFLLAMTVSFGLLRCGLRCQSTSIPRALNRPTIPPRAASAPTSGSWAISASREKMWSGSVGASTM
jgi:tubulin polyglutamylase TTLL6/13